MSNEIDDLVTNTVILKDKREVIKVIKSNPRSDRLALQLPLVNFVKEDDLYEVFPMSKDGKMGYMYLRLNDK